MSVNGAQGTSTADVYMRMSDRKYQQTLSDVQKDYSIFQQEQAAKAQADALAQAQEEAAASSGGGSWLGNAMGAVGDFVSSIMPWNW